MPLGSALAHIFRDESVRRMFKELVDIASAVVACRVSPIQKAQIVRFVRKATPSPITLAIGDGANDVSMIQEAHIGIGILGKEGLQAVQASDYALNEFQFLSRLLLVHGNRNYRRISLLVTYSFYKNMYLVMTLFLFGFFTGFSGTTLYDSWVMTGWSIFFTSTPVLAVGLFNQLASDQVLLANPMLYSERNCVVCADAHHKTHEVETRFGQSKLGIWVVISIVHSLFIIVGLTALGGVLSSDGMDVGYELAGSIKATIPVQLDLVPLDPASGCSAARHPIP